MHLQIDKGPNRTAVCHLITALYYGLSLCSYDDHGGTGNRRTAYDFYYYYICEQHKVEPKSNVLQRAVDDAPE